MKHHRHTASMIMVQQADTCVVRNKQKCAPETHSGNRLVEICECGARRHTNFKYNFMERGVWFNSVKKGYICEGSVCGWCHTFHRTLAGAVRCLREHRRSCKMQGGYSDRYIYEATRQGKEYPKAYKQVFIEIED